MFNKIRKDLQEYSDNAVRKDSTVEELCRIGKVTAINPGKTYDLQGTDGDATYSSISNSVPRVKWSVGQWVMFEFNGLDWAITGIAPHAGD